MHSESDKPLPSSGRRQLTIILVMAFFSLGGSYALFFSAKGGASWGTTNNGVFVQPATTVAALGWAHSRANDTGDVWTMVALDSS